MDLENLKNTSKKKLFNFKNFKKIINFIKSKDYKFARFDKKNLSKRVYLRHDIDFDPKYLSRFLSFYKKEKIVSNIFFLINAKTYNLIEKKNIILINNICKNHCVGLHIDLSELSFSKTYETIKFYKKYINISNVISFHRPKKYHLYKLTDQNNFLNAYDKNFFVKKFYVSDSGQKKDFHFKLIDLINNNEKMLQLLIHPIWWQGRYKKKDILNFIYDDQKNDIKQYLINNNNFFKNI